MKGFKDKDKKFHPITNSKGVRKKRNTKELSGMKIGSGVRKARSLSTLKLPKDVDISKHNWGFETDSFGNILRLRLGNWIDAGWHWSGEADSLNTFMIRIAKEDDERLEFINEMEKEGIVFEMLKKQMLKNLSGKLTPENDDGIYSLSGDNVRWKFGQDDDSIDLSGEFDFAVSDLDLDENKEEEFLREFWNHFNGVDYDEFLKERGERIRDEMIKVINKSDNYDEYFDGINDLGFPYGLAEEEFNEMQQNNIGVATSEAVDAIKAREKEQGIKTRAKGENVFEGTS